MVGNCKEICLVKFFLLLKCLLVMFKLEKLYCWSGESIEVCCKCLGCIFCCDNMVIELLGNNILFIIDNVFVVWYIFLLVVLLMIRW